MASGGSHEVHCPWQAVDVMRLIISRIYIFAVKKFHVVTFTKMYGIIIC